jgi:hypothetical protein
MAAIAIPRWMNARPGLLFESGSFRTSSVATLRVLVSFVVMARAFLFRCLLLNTFGQFQRIIPFAQMKHSEDRWDEHQRGYGGAKQASDDRAS